MEDTTTSEAVTSSADSQTLRGIIDKWAQSEEAEEMLAQFAGKASLGGCFKRTLQSKKTLDKCQDSFEAVLEKQLYANYYLLDKYVGRGEQIMKFTRLDMVNYLMTKKLTLKLMFACAYNIKDKARLLGPDLEGAIFRELITGVDESVLSLQEMQQIPHDYIRQVCFLQTPEPEEVKDIGDDQEEFARISADLVRVYKDKHANRYKEKLELFADGYAAEFSRLETHAKLTNLID